MAVHASTTRCASRSTIDSRSGKQGAKIVNDAQSTIAGLKAQACPGGGWNGMPAELEGRATVADCLAHGVCGCIYGDAVQHIELLRTMVDQATAAINRSSNEIEGLQAVLKPFSDLASAVLAETPSDAGYFSFFLDSQGLSHRITMDQLRAAIQQSPQEPK